MKQITTFTIISLSLPAPPGPGDSSSSSETDTQLCRAASSAALSHTVESTTVTHSSADWWDLLLPLA